MKVSVKSINSYLERPLSTEDMVAALERSEVEVEEILYANKIDSKVIIAKITKVEPHPNADRLRLVTIDTGVGTKKLVCGAPNVKNSLVVAFAQVGTILPGGIEIKAAEIRGEKSDGMLCSERELGLSQDHSGIVELDPALPLGKSLCDIAELGDCLDLTTPSNRWDYLSIIGLAREIAAFSLNNSLVEPDIAKNEYQNREVTKVKEKGGCRRFISVKYVVKNDMASPSWLVDNLEANGMNSINPVVDITNWVMLEYGQPSHAFAADKISGNLQVRYGSPAEKLKLLNGKEITFVSEDLVIADDDGPLDLAGVMGGQKAEVEPNTTEIVLTIANFDKTTVRRQALRHGVRTEASARFERGLPLPLPVLAADRLAGLLKEICAAKIVDSPADQLFAEIHGVQIGLRLRRAEAVLGMKLGERQLANGLKARGFEINHFSLAHSIKEVFSRNIKTDSELLTTVFGPLGLELDSKTGWSETGEIIDANLYRAGDILWLGNNMAICQDKNSAVVVEKGRPVVVKPDKIKQVRRVVPSLNHILAVAVPWWRTDVSMAEDLYEEAAKIFGYDTMPPTLPESPPMDTHEFQALPKLTDLKQAMVTIGCTEIMTYSLVSAEMVDMVGGDLSRQIEIVNPMVKEQAYLRSGLLASHLKAIAANRNTDEVDVFELSKVSWLENGSKSVAPNEEWRLAISSVGESSLKRLKALLDAVLARSRIEVSIEAAQKPAFVLGRYGQMFLGGKFVAEYGQINPATLKNHNIPPEVSYAEIKIELVLSSVGTPQPKAIPPYRYVGRNLALELPVAVSWQHLHEQISSRKHVVKADFVDSYQNSELKAAKRKSVTVEIEFDLGPQPKTATIDQQLTDLVEALKSDPQLSSLTLR
ncbi:phenylalanine--tRNA ligase subunit beta [Candidatus Saccharibacteria bacterium]|nr:phenylalanine--tRNA ligase subunit beta [Candidatus Saccharibacteria bacterium]